MSGIPPRTCSVLWCIRASPLGALQVRQAHVHERKEEAMSAQFKVGDKVRVTDAEYADGWIGETGVLTGVGEVFRTYDGRDHAFELRMDDGALVFAVSVEKVNDATKPEDKADVEPEDERISAWETIASHPIFDSCRPEERPLLKAMMAKLDRIYTEPEFVVGQQVSGDDYKRLPVGAKAAFQGVGSGITKVGEHEWHDSHGCPLFDVTDFPRTLTHLPDAPESEDADDVEPEPLKEGDWVQVWAQVGDGGPDSDGEVPLTVRRARTSAGTLVGRNDTYVLPDAIVRPALGQTPPWVKPARCTSVKRTVGDRAALWQCTRDEHADGSHECGDVEWTTAEEYGRVEVSS